jgi:hypothetical protein
MPNTSQLKLNWQKQSSLKTDAFLQALAITSYKTPAPDLKNLLQEALNLSENMYLPVPYNYYLSQGKKITEVIPHETKSKRVDKGTVIATIKYSDGSQEKLKANVSGHIEKFKPYKPNKTNQLQLINHIVSLYVSPTNRLLPISLAMMLGSPENKLLIENLALEKAKDNPELRLLLIENFKMHKKLLDIINKAQSKPKT